MTDAENTFDPNAAAAADAGVFGLPIDPDRARVWLVPVPFEVTTSYGGGTSKGPAAIFEASKQVDLFDLDNGKPYEAGIHFAEPDREVVRANREGKKLAQAIIAKGGAIRGNKRLEAALARVNELSESMNERVYDQTARAMESGRLVGVVGGDHSTPFGAIRAVAERHPGVGILHVDAHADLREAYEGFTWSHASIMHNVATRIPDVAKIVQVGIRDFCEAEFEFIRASAGRITTHFDRDVQLALFRGEPFAKVASRIVSGLPPLVYVSFDIDGLEPTLCPHTGTPVAGGLSFAQAVHLLDEVVRSGRRIVGFDLNEVAPGPRGDEWDANVGARLLYKVIGFALRSEPKRGATTSGSRTRKRS